MRSKFIGKRSGLLWGLVFGEAAEICNDILDK